MVRMVGGVEVVGGGGGGRRGGAVLCTDVAQTSAAIPYSVNNGKPDRSEWKAWEPTSRAATAARPPPFTPTTAVCGHVQYRTGLRPYGGSGAKHPDSPRLVRSVSFACVRGCTVVLFVLVFLSVGAGGSARQRGLAAAPAMGGHRPLARADRGVGGTPAPGRAEHDARRDDEAQWAVDPQAVTVRKSSTQMALCAGTVCGGNVRR